MSNYSNALIYGKDATERIVSIETKGENLHIFRELEDGAVVEEIRPATYWFLTNRSISPAKEYKLEGDQHWRYYHEFTTQEAMQEVSKKLYQKRIDKYAMWDTKEANLVINGMTYYKGMQLKDVSVLSFDIESDGLVPTKNSEIYIVTGTFRKGETIIRKGFFLDEYESQADMLVDMCRWTREMNPSLVIGHNIYGYDFNYMEHVARLNKARLSLGRDGSDLRFNDRVSKFRKDGSQDYEYKKAYIYGREIVDTMFLSIKYDIGRAFPSYGLKPIIKHLGLEKEGRTFIDAGSMRKIYHERHTNPEMWEKAKQYAIEDSDDALKLFDLMAPSFFYMTQSISKSFQEINTGATGSQINNIMVRSYLQDGHSVAMADEAVKFEGGISFGVPGVYTNCLKVDVSSLYPSIMRQFKVYNAKKDPKKHFLQLVETFTIQRLKNKATAEETGNKYYDDLQNSEKTLINSMYGALGANGLNYNSPPDAAFVTEKGREVLEQSTIFSTGFNVQYWKDKVKGEDGDEDEQ